MQICCDYVTVRFNEFQKRFKCVIGRRLNICFARTDSKAIKLIVISLIHCNTVIRQFIMICPVFLKKKIMAVAVAYQISKKKPMRSIVYLEKFALRAFYVVYVFVLKMFIWCKYMGKENNLECCSFVYFSVVIGCRCNRRVHRCHCKSQKLNQCKAIYSMNKIIFVKNV